MSLGVKGSAELNRSTGLTSGHRDCIASLLNVTSIQVINLTCDILLRFHILYGIVSFTPARRLNKQASYVFEVWLHKSKPLLDAPFYIASSIPHVTEDWQSSSTCDRHQG